MRIQILIFGFKGLIKLPPLEKGLGGGAPFAKVCGLQVMQVSSQ